MLWFVLSFTSVLFFSISARQLLKTLTGGLDWSRLAQYSQRALRVERSYKVMAWTLMTAFWIYTCVISFWQSFISGDLKL